MGNNKARKKLYDQLEQCPLTLGDKNMKEVKVLKYLGDYLGFSLEESVHQTGIKRASVVKMAILEIRTIIEDSRANDMGALNLAFMFWETSVLPMLIFNCESWLCMSRKAIKVLDNIFLIFCWIIFRVSTGFPLPSLYWQVALCQWRI